MNQEKQPLRKELKTLNGTLSRLIMLAHEVPWVNWAAVYDPIGDRRDEVKAALER